MNSTTSFDFTSFSMNCSMLIFASFVARPEGRGWPVKSGGWHICTPKPLSIQSKMPGSWHAVPSPGGHGGAPAATRPGCKNHRHGEAFILDWATYLGRATPWNSSAGPTFSPKSETPVTKPASAAAPLAEPSPSFFSDSTTLAGKLTEAYLAGRHQTARRAAPLPAE